MIWEEFVSRLPENVRIPTEEEYKTMEYVYNWHPSIKPSEHEGQEQIARLYSEFGMRIIYDMEETASKMEHLNEMRFKAKKEFEDIEKEIAELSCKSAKMRSCTDQNILPENFSKCDSDNGEIKIITNEIINRHRRIRSRFHLSSQQS